jgi:hypothetical protein
LLFTWTLIKFYHFNIDIDIPQAKIFLQSVNFGEGALGFSGGTAPFGPPGLRAWRGGLEAGEGKGGELRPYIHYSFFTLSTIYSLSIAVIIGGDRGKEWKGKEGEEIIRKERNGKYGKEKEREVDGTGKENRMENEGMGIRVIM